ncbi:MAG: hypothetical protein IKO36_09730 [Bacteroidaceae bacterium]|nr:hypothetical protein [Bacteroidaceae bacterium]
MYSYNEFVNEKLVNEKHAYEFTENGEKGGTKTYRVYFIPESGHEPFKNERGTVLANIVLTIISKDGYAISQRDYNKRLYFDAEGNVYDSKTSKKPWFNFLKIK